MTVTTLAGSRKDRGEEAEEAQERGSWEFLACRRKARIVVGGNSQ